MLLNSIQQNSAIDGISHDLVLLYWLIVFYVIVKNVTKNVSAFSFHLAPFLKGGLYLAGWPKISRRSKRQRLARYCSLRGQYIALKIQVSHLFLCLFSTSSGNRKSQGLLDGSSPHPRKADNTKSGGEFETLTEGSFINKLLFIKVKWLRKRYIDIYIYIYSIYCVGKRLFSGVFMLARNPSRSQNYHSIGQSQR